MSRRHRLAKLSEARLLLLLGIVSGVLLRLPTPGEGSEAEVTLECLGLNSPGPCIPMNRPVLQWRHQNLAVDPARSPYVLHTDVCRSMNDLTKQTEIAVQIPPLCKH